MKKWWYVWCFFGIAATLWMSRWIWLQPFDIQYLESIFERSQWRIPNSKTVIADNELYQVAGWRIIGSQDFYTTNPEVPPAGKYLYGWSERVFGSPYWASLLLYAGCLGLFGWLTLSLPVEARKWAWLWWIWNPLLSLQVSQTMLDLPQLFFLLLHLVALWQWTNSRQILRKVGWLVVAGVGLGLFCASKIGLFVPVILLADGLYFWRKKQLRWLWPLTALVGLTYAISYAPYVWSHGPVAWLKAQKWMLNFYAISRVKPLYGMPILTALTGLYHGWWKQGWIWTREWNVLWATSLIVALHHWWTVFRRKSWLKLKNWDDYILVLFSGLGLAFCLIPFWSRYFLIILPLGILLAARFLHQHTKWCLILSSIVVLQWWISMIPTPTERVQFALSTWRNQQWEQLYEFLPPDKRAAINRDEFATQKFGTPIPTSFNYTVPWPWETTQSITFYIRSMAGFTTQTIRATRIGSQWYLDF